MDKNSTPSEEEVVRELQRLLKSGKVPSKYRSILLYFYEGGKQALLSAGQPLTPFLAEFKLFISLVEKQLDHPFVFEPYHRKVRSPIDYYRFALEFIRPLIDIRRSRVFGEDVADRIEAQLRAGENAILLANHQTEPDPQAIALLLEKSHPTMAQEMIFVAGERVVTDPLAVPFSMGCDLLCIYSKRYIDQPAELKAKKQLHNKHTMEQMSRLLMGGGKVIYVAPSGGRDRKDEQGIVQVAPFDPQSLEMFNLMARKAKTPTHFYPLTLATYDLLPPPETIQAELGEVRIAKYTPIHLTFSPQFDMDRFAGAEESDKELRRKYRAEAIWKIVNGEYQRLNTL